MITEIRDRFNASFTPEKYQALLDSVSKRYDTIPIFRVAETPLFISHQLKERLLEACALINETICRPDIKEITQGALYDPKYIVPNEDDHTIFLQMDFGICLDENNEPFPMLIEAQGFPSVYFFQYIVAQEYRYIYDIPEHLTSLFHGLDLLSYKSLLQEIIVGDEDPKHVVLLEIEPEKQTTYIDMKATSVELGIPVVCISKVIKSENKLYYKDESDNLIQIKRIYNRVIFDELDQRPDLHLDFKFTDDLDVEWVGHPNWFYRISKFILPFLKNKYVPETHFLKDMESYPEDLENWVLKPLFSFAGAGVLIDITKEDLDAVQNKSNFILQRKVHYEPILKAPNEPVKAEIRMLMLWPKQEPKPYVINNLVRLSKGKMIGVKYNKDKDWVGGSVGFFEP
ncbi:MAG: hypothetical protein R2774_06680 [Saprospiraceae bacterium]